MDVYAYGAIGIFILLSGIWLMFRRFRERFTGESAGEEIVSLSINQPQRITRAQDLASMILENEPDDDEDEDKKGRGSGGGG